MFCWAYTHWPNIFTFQRLSINDGRYHFRQYVFNFIYFLHPFFFTWHFNCAIYVSSEYFFSIRISLAIFHNISISSLRRHVGFRFLFNNFHKGMCTGLYEIYNFIIFFSNFDIFRIYVDLQLYYSFVIYHLIFLKLSISLIFSLYTTS